MHFFILTAFFIDNVYSIDNWTCLYTHYNLQQQHVCRKISFISNVFTLIILCCQQCFYHIPGCYLLCVLLLVSLTIEHFISSCVYNGMQRFVVYILYDTRFIFQNCIILAITRWDTCSSSSKIL